MIIIGASIYKEPAWYDSTFDMSFAGSGYNEVLGIAFFVIGLLMLFPLIKIAFNSMNKS